MSDDIHSEDIVAPITKKRGRPRNENYLPWDEAREMIRGEMIPSRSKFFAWWDANKPKAIPRFPYRVYTEEWTSWNDFLGTDNKFNEKVGTKWRPLVEATVFVHKLQLKSHNEWFDWCKVEGNLPADIPARPDLVYDDWRSWNHWLGNRPAEAIEAKKEAQRVQVYYIVHEPGAPGNVLTFGVESTLSSMKERWEREQCDIVKLFWYEPEKAQIISQIVNAFSSTYREYDRERIVPNVWEIVYHLQMHMQVVTPADANR